MAMPSVTVMVVNSRGVPPAAATPCLTAWAERDVAGGGFVPGRGDADERLGHLLLGHAHCIEIGAVGCALGAHGGVAAGQLRLVEAADLLSGHI
jgi:hypothetical protein